MTPYAWSIPFDKLKINRACSPTWPDFPSTQCDISPLFSLIVWFWGLLKYFWKSTVLLYCDSLPSAGCWRPSPVHCRGSQHFNNNHIDGRLFWSLGCAGKLADWPTETPCSVMTNTDYLFDSYEKHTCMYCSHYTTVLYALHIVFSTRFHLIANKPTSFR